MTGVMVGNGGRGVRGILGVTGVDQVVEDVRGGCWTRNKFGVVGVREKARGG